MCKKKEVVCQLCTKPLTSASGVLGTREAFVCFMNKDMNDKVLDFWRVLLNYFWSLLFYTSKQSLIECMLNDIECVKGSSVYISRDIGSEKGNNSLSV